MSIDCSAPDADCEITKEPLTYPALFFLEADKSPVQYQGPLTGKAYAILFSLFFFTSRN